jgi:hypothetical protein
MSDLPRTGKSVLAREHKAAWWRIDTIEQVLRNLCGIRRTK